MKKILLSLTTVGIVAALALGFSGAFFSDTETSTGNVLQAGKVDLLIDNTSYLNGVLNPGTTWTADNLPGHLFFNFSDIKPGDRGEDTISLKVDNNDAWACMSITNTEDDDKSCTEPELLDDPTCSPPPEPDGDLTDGELGKHLFFMFWADDGDNVLEDNEDPTWRKFPRDKFDGTIWPLADALTNIWGTPGPLEGGKTYYIAKAWCFGTSLAPSPYTQDGFGPDSLRTPANSTGGISCTGGELLDNSTQTDSFKLDVEFSAYQSRNNPGFVCGGPPVSVTPTLSPTPTTPVACPADVMLVLDRSGSINSTELGQLKTAAKLFVDDMGLTPAGIHAGQTSFATTGSLDHILSSDSVTLKATIDALISGGFTNLKAGIDLASGELAGGNDRPDGTSPDKMVIITDGHPNRPFPSGTADDVAAASATAFKIGGEIFVVGVGSDVNTAYLQSIATNAGHYYSVSNYSGLEEVLEDLNVCPN